MATETNPVSEFERAGTDRPGIFGEMLEFLRHNKKWWLAPMLVILLLITVLVFLVGTGAAPFIYTLF